MKGALSATLATLGVVALVVIIVAGILAAIGAGLGFAARAFCLFSGVCV